ncbi:hypothetical protein [Streptomyces sp. NPDC001933]|uniref:hypothetical protein n=1 Tax=Streptomyces sp. NPDC001933 TaxID=3364626 RepID=UPI0036853D2F
MERVLRAWDRAVDTGLMEGGTETKYHFTPDGEVLSVAVGRSGQVLANGERLTPSVAERLRMEMPLLTGMVTFYENNQLAGRGLGSLDQRPGRGADASLGGFPPPASGGDLVRANRQ